MVKQTTITKQVVNGKIFTNSNENFDDFQHSVQAMEFAKQEPSRQKILDYIFSKNIIIDVSVSSYKVENEDTSEQYLTPKNSIRTAGATSSVASDAVFKAIIEAYERYCSHLEVCDIFSAAKQLKNVILPNQIQPLTERQVLKGHLRHFSESKKIKWRRGHRVKTGNYVFIPTDLVYYDHKEHRSQLIRLSTSSGIAAFTNFAEARKRALIELIERDAIMQNWFAQIPARKISTQHLSEEILQKIKIWESENRKVFLLELPSNYGRVVEICIVGKSYPCFVCGAAATIEFDEESTNRAIKKALEEAEFSLCFAEIAQINEEYRKKYVHSPYDHGAFYYTEQNAKQLEWLYSGEEQDDFEIKKIKTVEEIMREVDAIVVDLSEDKSELQVVRIMSPKLIPISFGYGMLNHTHPYIKQFNAKSLELPHYFA